MENKFMTYNFDAKAMAVHTSFDTNRCWSKNHVSENSPFGINNKKVQTARALPLKVILKSPFIS